MESDPSCTVTGCTRRRYQRGWCRAHLGRYRRHGDVQASIPISDRLPRDRPCSVDRCDRASYKGGVCSGHRQRMRKHGSYREDEPIRDQSPCRRPIIDLPGGLRVCPGCWRPKPLVSFPLRTDVAGGRKTRCDQCRADYAARWQANNSQRVQTYMARTRARKQGYARRPHDSTVTKEALRGVDGDLCCYCGVEMDFTKIGIRDPRPRKMATLEHILPVSRGGLHEWGNCALACWRCNTSKGPRQGPEWTIREGHRLAR